MDGYDNLGVMFDAEATTARAMTGTGAERHASWRMFDALPTGVCIATPSGRIVYANPHLHELLGYPYGELEGEDVGLLQGGEALPASGLPLEGKGGRERRYRCRDGEFVWVVEAVSRYEGENGAPYELRTVTDVSHHRRAEAALRDQLIMKDVLFETLPVPVFLKDEDGRFIDCNDAFERYTGLPRTAVIEKTSFDVLDPPLAHVHAEMDRDLMVHWGQRSYEEAVPHADGLPRRARVSKAVYRDSTGAVGGIVGVIHDLAAEDQPSEARLQTILEQSPIGVSVSRREDGVVIFANTRFAELIGLPRDQVVGSLARDYYVDDVQRERVIERLRASGSVVNMEVQFKRADDTSFWTLFTVNQAVIQGVQVNLAWIYDYTERRNMEEALRDMASKDPLTGIYNRRSFMELGRQQLARSLRFREPMSVVVLDVDHFKKINDTYGHATGDDALRMVASACASILREYDILGRLGGEEFVVVLPGATADESRVVAERLRRHIARMPVPGPEGRFHLTGSMGIAGIEPSDTLEKAIHRADLALYRAKREGRNRVVVFESGM